MDEAPQGVSGSKVVAVILIAIALMLSLAFYLWFQAKAEFKKQPEVTRPR
jgi:hypothetical protein